MRLTLRTLLAYLDNSLEPQDAADLRHRVEESGFATALVARIRAVAGNPDLAAPAPDAVGPLEDANAISEYLDSTLTSEQVAEIERACLESDLLLAEASACHEILAMALAQSAVVLPSLRERIYQLPDRVKEGTRGGHSSLSIPAATAGSSAGAESPLAHKHPEVVPVGPEDSGVSDAPTRLRKIDAAEAASRGEVQPAIAGARARALMEATDYYGRSIRPSRITPWLVSLALVAVLLFAIVQIFKPLLSRQTAQVNTDEQGARGAATLANDGNVDQPAGAAAAAATVADPGRSTAADADAADDTRSDADTQAEPAPEANTTVASTDSTSNTEVADDSATQADGAAAVPSTDTSATDASVDPADASEPAIAAVAETTDAADRSPVDAVAGETTTSSPENALANSEAPAMASGEEAALPDEAAAEAPAAELATLTSNNTLLFSSQDGQPWTRVQSDQPLASVALICAPVARANLTTAAGVDLTLVGPTGVQLIGTNADNLGVVIDYGRVVLAAGDQDVAVVLEFGGNRYRCRFSEPGSTTTISVEYFRGPGRDPLDPDNREVVSRVVTASGTVEFTALEGASLSPATDTVRVEPNWQWIQRGGAASEISAVAELPPWTNPDTERIPTLQLGAKAVLLEQLEGAQSLEMTLREAVNFRRIEVGALAAQTLLLLGHSDVYFGGDGVLSEPRQRVYWRDHYWALIAAVDRSAESAAEVNESIEQMDAADHQVLFKLLVGYSQAELEAGGDAELVELLGSPSMAVRVLALENLRRITGTTGNFNPADDNVVRRQPDVKKWQVRLRKSDIRWPAAGRR